MVTISFCLGTIDNRLTFFVIYMKKTNENKEN